MRCSKPGSKGAKGIDWSIKARNWLTAAEIVRRGRRMLGGVPAHPLPWIRHPTAPIAICHP